MLHKTIADTRGLFTFMDYFKALGVKFTRSYIPCEKIKKEKEKKAHLGEKRSRKREAL
jgi:hypothetical protein